MTVSLTGEEVLAETCVALGHMLDGNTGLAGDSLRRIVGGPDGRLNLYGAACGWAAVAARYAGCLESRIVTKVEQLVDDVDTQTLDDYHAAAAIIPAVGNGDPFGALGVWNQLDDRQAVRVAVLLLKVAAAYAAEPSQVDEP